MVAVAVLLGIVALYVLFHPRRRPSAITWFTEPGVIGGCEKYVCTVFGCDYAWWRPEVGCPTPNCPTHNVEVARLLDPPATH